MCLALVASLQGNAALFLSGRQNISPKTAFAVEVTHTERRFCTTFTEEPPWPSYFFKFFFQWQTHQTPLHPAEAQEHHSALPPA